MYLPSTSTVWLRLGSVRRQLSSALSRNHRRQRLMRAAEAAVAMLEQRTLLSLTVSPGVSPSPVTEGSAVSLSFSATMDSSTTIASGFYVNWGDGSGDTYYPTQWFDSKGHGPFDSPAGPGTFTAQAQPTHTYLEPSGRSGYSVAAWAYDSNSDQGCSIVMETVSEATPSVSVSGNASAQEGSTYTISPGFNDPGGDSVSQWQVNWGDGTPTEFDAPASSYSHVFNTAGNFNINATATSEDGQFGAPSLPVNVIGATPAAPTNLAASGTAGNVSVTWQAPNSQLTGYELQRSANGSDSGFADLPYSGTTPSFPDTTAAIGGTYWYQVRAMNGNSPSPWATMSSPLVLTPSVPTGLAVASQTPLSLTLSWNAAAGATSYLIYREAPGETSYVRHWQ